MTTQQDFYDNIDGALTPEQAAQAYALAATGDTSAELENSGVPATTTATEEGKGDDGEAAGQAKGESGKGGAEAGTGEEGIDPSKAVVLARDGKHTIPYERLEKARQGEQHWRAQAEAAQQQLSELQAQAQARADAGQAPTTTDNMVAKAEAAIEAGVDASLFGDFSEEALAAGIQKLVEQQVQARVNQALAPLTQKQQQDAATDHYSAIYGKHPDADSIAQSSEFEAWVNSQPSVVRNAYLGLFDPQTGGTAEQIIEVFDAFKAATIPQKSETSAANNKGAASAAVANAKAEPPSSLSSIPGGRAAGSNALDATADMTGLEMMVATQNMTPQQLEAWLNRTV